MRKSDAITQLQKEAKALGFVVVHDPNDGTLQLCKPMDANSLTAIRQVLRAIRRRQKVRSQTTETSRSRIRNV